MMPGEMLKGLIEVLRNPRLKPILALNFCNYACTFTVQGLWGGAFLREVATRVWAFDGTHLRDFDGPFVEWEQNRQDRARRAGRA